MDWNQVSFIVLSLTGFFIMSFGSLGVWFLCTLMDVTTKMILLPIGMGSLIVFTAIKFFGA